MNRYVAFLRGMNLGKRRLEMSQLKTLFEELGYGQVATFIASGNVIFSTRERNAQKLEVRIAEHLERSLGYGVDTFVRTLDEVAVTDFDHAQHVEHSKTGSEAHTGEIDEASSITISLR